MTARFSCVRILAISEMKQSQERITSFCQACSICSDQILPFRALYAPSHLTQPRRLDQLEAACWGRLIPPAAHCANRLVTADCLGAYPARWA